MSLPEKDEVRLRHMLEASEQALQFAHGRTRADLDADAIEVAIRPSMSGALRSAGAVAKCSSTVRNPARNSANRSRPIATITDRPIAESTE